MMWTRMQLVARRAFTLVELLVVIIILAIVLAIAVPAYEALIFTSAESQSTNSLQVGVQYARNAAASSKGRSDAAAVFTYEPDGRLSILTCVSVGTLRDALDPNSPDSLDFVEREVFAPISTIQPVQLPRDWAVRGLAGAGTVEDGDNSTFADAGWYDDGNLGEGNYDPEESNWLFPEEGFFDPDEEDAGMNRQTFMVRFQGGVGNTLPAGGSSSLVLLPSPSIDFRDQSPFSEYRADRTTNLERFARSILNAPPTGFGLNGELDWEERLDLLGDISVDTALARSVGEFAVTNEPRLARGIGGGLNEETNSLYLPFEEASNDGAEIDDSLVPGLSDPQEITQRINEWIVGTNGSGTPTQTEARLFGAPRHGGSLVELTGTRREGAN